MRFDQYGFFIGDFQIRYYGIILMTGVLAAVFLSRRRARNKGRNEEFIWDALIWVLIAGIIGARLWHIFTPPPSMVERGITTAYYLTHPLDAMNIRAGGLGIPGAVIGGALALYIYARKRKENFLIWTDIISPGLALAQAIGRWGNFVNQELYGLPTNLPWGIYIPPERRLPEFIEYERYHPTFLYESLANLASMGLLLWVSNKYGEKLKVGGIFLIYMINYSVIRVSLEFLRLDSSLVWGVNANQIFTILVGLVSMGILVYRQRIESPFLKEEEVL
jgi:phosphatidylglycerol:prolipoprotein diacylglycerol transferase